MARSRFVIPDIVRLSLSDGNYIDVKRRLTAGEERHLMSRMITKLEAGEKPVLDPAQVGRTKILEYMIGWGGPGFMQGDRPVEWSEGALDQLDGETYKEIAAAIDAHEDAEDAKRATEKNDQAGENKSLPISPSVSSTV